MKLFTHYACDGCPEEFDRDNDDEVHRIVTHNGGSRIPSLLSAIRVESLHFCSLHCRTRAVDGIDWDALADFALEAIRAPGLEAARVANSGPPAERIRRPPSLAQLARGIEDPDEPDPPLAPMGSQAEQDTPF